MITFRKFVRAVLLSAAFGTALTTVPAADAAGFSAAGFHGGMSAGAGFRGGFRGGTQGTYRAGDFRGQHPDWHRYGFWQNGVWIGIWPGYYDDAYNQFWNYYCDPESPYFDPDVCSDQ